MFYRHMRIAQYIFVRYQDRLLTRETNHAFSQEHFQGFDHASNDAGLLAQWITVLTENRALTARINILETTD